MSGELTKRRAVNSTIVRKILISAAVAAGAFILSSISDNDSIENSVMLSVLVGGVTVIVQFLHESEHRLRMVEQGQAAHAARVEQGQISHADRMEELVQDFFNKINDATRLYGRVEATGLSQDAVTQLMRHFSQLDASSSPLILDFAQSEVGRVSEFLKNLSERTEVVYDGEDRDWLLGLARTARTSIDAISLFTVDAGGRSFVDGGLWMSDLGQRYLEIQRDTVQRGVTIRRIFVLDRPSLSNDPDLLQVYRLQKDLGIRVRTLDPRSIPRLKSWLFDFILFDGVVSYETTPASHVESTTQPIIVSTRIVQHAQTVENRIRRFEELWAAAADFEPDAPMVTTPLAHDPANT